MYLWLKALHIIAVISWMAGLLYLPRLFVYHTAAEPGSQQAKTFEVMEHRLLAFIMTPAMSVTWLVGIVMVFYGQWFTAGWFHAKIVLVVAMTIMHGLLGHWAAEFKHGRNHHSQKFYRIINEIPTVLMILIVVLTVMKPL